MFKHLVAGLVLSAALAVAPAYAETITWKMQSLMPAGSSANKQFETFAQQVDQMSGGRLKIEVVPIDSIVQSDETLDAISQGILDGHFGSVGYFAGQDPAFGVLGHFLAGYETPEQFRMFYEQGGGLEIARELYSEYNVHFIGAAFWQPEAIPSRKPLRSVDDFKDLKMRAPGGVAGQVFSAMGASVVTLPGSEVFQALSSGVVDATDYSTLGQNAQVGLYDVAKFTIYPSITSMPATDISVNSDKWNALPDDLKAIVESAASEFASNLATATFLDDQDALTKIKGEGVEIINWAPEERRKLRQLAADAMKTYAEDSELAKKAYDAHIAFMTKINLL
jgi:TRAP-type mannitol/chloroaromatic compound transport system substrate-binding protein